jgi:hypothetical protein
MWKLKRVTLCAVLRGAYVHKVMDGMGPNTKCGILVPWEKGIEIGAVDEVDCPYCLGKRSRWQA